MTPTDRMEEYLVKSLKQLKEGNKQLREKLEEQDKAIEQMEEALKDYELIKKLKISDEPNTPIRQFTRLGTLPNNDLKFADKLKYDKNLQEVYDIINTFYSYQSNQTIYRPIRDPKYPRYICMEHAKPDIVLKLFTYGCLDKVFVDETLYSISKLPSIIVKSVKAMMGNIGSGLYGIQIFDASTDLVGKPIIICQLFKTGEKTTIEGNNMSINAKIPCKIEYFQNWLCEKRALGVLTIKSKIESMINERKTYVLGQEKGGEVEEIITLYYSKYVTNDNDNPTLEDFNERLTNLEHTHAPKTIEEYNFKNKRRSMAKIEIKEENSSPFMNM